MKPVARKTLSPLIFLGYGYQRIKHSATHKLQWTSIPLVRVHVLLEGLKHVRPGLVHTHYLFFVVFLTSELKLQQRSFTFWNMLERAARHPTLKPPNFDSACTSMVNRATKYLAERYTNISYPSWSRKQGFLSFKNKCTIVFKSWFLVCPRFPVCTCFQSIKLCMPRKSICP